MERCWRGLLACSDDAVSPFVDVIVLEPKLFEGNDMASLARYNGMLNGALALGLR